MFTGIITEIGRIRRIRRGNIWRVTIEAPKVSENIRVGDSVAVNGVCLSAVGSGTGMFEADISGETVRRTTFSNIKPGSSVNLEMSLPVSGRLDGHIVQGHVDEVGRVIRVSGAFENRTLAVRPETRQGTLLVDKGSICIDGVSLTVIEPDDYGQFSVAVIPLTLRTTTLKDLKPGDKVNLEYDILGKYVARLSKGA